jgi:hypothetical protein
MIVAKLVSGKAGQAPLVLSVRLREGHSDLDVANHFAKQRDSTRRMGVHSVDEFPPLTRRRAMGDYLLDDSGQLEGLPPRTTEESLTASRSLADQSEKCKEPEEA